MGYFIAEMSMLTLDFDNMASIYLTVPLNELETFMDVNDLEFVNTKYGLNEKDEFEIVYTEVINKRTGKTYIFDNTERKSLAFLEADDNFVPFEQLQGAKMEHLLLEEIKNNIMEEAQDQNIISDHTKIDARTKVINTTDASGKSIYNYDVEVSYTVDEEYSATDDFAPGRFKCEESNAALAMLAIVKKALTGHRRGDDDEGPDDDEAGQCQHGTHVPLSAPAEDVRHDGRPGILCDGRGRRGVPL